MREPAGHAQVQGFVDRVPNVYRAADTSDGFHARSIRDVGTWLHSWGEIELPACYPAPPSNDYIATTLSLWHDLESVAAFTYHGPHGEALTKRRDWFEKHDLPIYVAWWVAADHSIDWKEGNARLEHLRVNGPTAVSFDFAHPFDPEGNATRLDREMVKAKAAMNAAAQAS
ncbi:MAG: DUF3291 domain-containing protein [Acidobacteria bacterium]|nr:DUF3291 domain-containing protein [Acidobacteriota bacterium]